MKTKRIFALLLAAIFLVVSIPGLIMAKEKTKYEAIKILPEYLFQYDTVKDIKLHVVGVNTEGTLTDITDKVTLKYDVYAGDAYQIGMISNNALTLGHTRSADFSKEIDFGPDEGGITTINFYRITSDEYFDPDMEETICMLNEVGADNTIVKFDITSNSINLDTTIEGVDSHTYLNEHLSGELTITTGQALNNFTWTPCDLFDINQSCVQKNPEKHMLTGIDTVAGVVSADHSPGTVIIGGWTSREEIDDKTTGLYYLEEESDSIAVALTAARKGAITDEIPSSCYDTSARYKYVGVIINLNPQFEDNEYLGFDEDWDTSSLKVDTDIPCDCKVVFYLHSKDTIEMVIRLTFCKHSSLISHDYVEASCTEAGNELYFECEDCGATLDAYKNVASLDSVKLDALGHIGGTATCSEYARCERCNKLYGEYNTNNHGSYGIGIRGQRNPSHTIVGYTGDKYCLGCNQVIEYGEEIPLTDHINAYLINEKDASCKEPGYTGDLYCPDCDKIIETGRVLDKLQHVPVDIPAEESTCTKHGYTAGVQCFECKEYIVKPEELPLKHQWDDGVVTVDADCIHEGIVLYTCTECSTHKEVAIGKDTTNHSTHTFIADYVAPTCIEDGYTGDEHCEACGAIVKQGEPISSTGHTFTRVSANAAACTEQGNIEYYTCDVCGKWYADINGEYEIINHNAVITPELGHDWDGGIITIEPTETTKGVKTITCGRCCITKTEDIPELNHVHNTTKVEAQNATCEASGNIEYYVCGCGKWFFDIQGTNEITEHNSVIVAKLEHSDANRDGKCDHCGIEVDVPFTEYAIIDGANSVWKRGSDTEVSLRSNADFAKLVQVLIDNDTLASDKYTIGANESVTLTKEYLNSLALGKHSISIVFNDGEATTEFTIVTEEDVPQTGDDFIIYATVVMIALIGIAIIVKNVKRKVRK